MAEEKEEEKNNREDEVIFPLRVTANREDQVMDFVSANASRKKLEVYSVIRPHGMRGYIFVEAASKTDAKHFLMASCIFSGDTPRIDS